MKIFLFLVGIYCISSNVSADDWILDQKGCKHLNPSPLPNEYIVWTGSCKGGFASGYGDITWYSNEKKSDTHSGEKVGGKFNDSSSLLGVLIGFFGPIYLVVWFIRTITSGRP